MLLWGEEVFAYCKGYEDYRCRWQVDVGEQIILVLEH